MESQESRIPVAIEEEMKSSFMDYAMSVIISRALPDVRDGLKPVHRRILVTLNDLGLSHARGFRKCAKIAGDVSGNYHPHGEGIVYPSLARMVQDFSLRYPLVDGQGNFGSVDGDPPAAMRYTEARMTALAEEMLRDIDKQTVDFSPNYDGTREEPAVLPARVPNLLINGSSGIAVGMATNIPPHNLTEVVHALVMLLEKPEATVEELSEIVPGPDFPTGGIISGRGGILEAHRTGRGIIQVRARAQKETFRRGGQEREAIIITEIPFQVNKAKLIERIADLVNERKLEAIADVRDESDRDGIRVVVELKKDESYLPVLNSLYKHTQMQESFGIINLALVDGQPRILTLKELLENFLTFRREVVLRRSRFELKRAEERAHILEGLKAALSQIDAVIRVIRRSRSPEEAREALMQSFKLTQPQAQAILDMRLQRLTALEQEKLEGEHGELKKTIAHLRRVLSEEGLLVETIKGELLEIKERFGDERRTEIQEGAQEIALEDMIVEEDMVVTVSRSGYIKRNSVSLYRSQRRGGKGIKGMGMKEEDFVEQLFVASTHDYMLFFTNTGRCHWLKVHEAPQAGRASRGKAIVNLLQLQAGESLTATLPIRRFEPERYLVMATRKGILKKTALSAFSNPRAGGIRAMLLDEGDELIAVRQTDGDRELFLATRQGKAIRFHEGEVRPMGRAARGVLGIRLAKEDEVIGMVVFSPGNTILTVTEKGFGKRTEVENYRKTRRGGKGIINLKLTERTGPVVGIRQVYVDDEFLLISEEGQVIRTSVRDVPSYSRATQGVRLMHLGEGDRVAALARLEEEEGEGEANTAK